MGCFKWSFSWVWRGQENMLSGRGKREMLNHRDRHQVDSASLVLLGNNRITYLNQSQQQENDDTYILETKT